MRKALIAAAVATALFAVGAFAASFTVGSEDTASGTNPVQSCATSASVDFTEVLNNATNNFVVQDAIVTLQGAADCVGADVRLVLQDNDGPETAVYDNQKLNIAHGADQVTIAGEVVTLRYTPATPIPVGDVWNAAVLVDGLQLTTT